jgi:predicted solute-binding protein
LVLRGEADAGLMPVVDHLFDGRLDTLEDIGVCAEGRVKSVILRSRLPLREVRAVASDPASRTSNLLARLVLLAGYGADAAIVGTGVEQEADAAVVIGDRALAMKPCAGTTDYDLAAEWHKLTGLPFVFAVWTCLKGNPRKERLSKVAAKSLDRGLLVLEDIAKRFADELVLKREVCMEYLHSCVYYRVGGREREGIREFAAQLKQYGLMPQEGAE